nr:gastrula zinc finger protein XlCGF44.2-like isoform X1 [Leptinotarsa decemlineata]
MRYLQMALSRYPIEEHVARHTLGEQNFSDLQLFHCCNCGKGLDIKHSCPRPKAACSLCKQHLVNVNTKKHKCFLRLNSDDTDKYFFKSTTIITEDVTADENRKSNKKYTNEVIIRVYRCRRCRLEFDSRKTYRKHLHQQHNEKYNVCPICGKSVVNLSQHRNGVHGDPASFRCSKCDKSFSCKRHLQRHMLAHGNEFKHKCTTCGKGFKTPFSMRVHMRSHDVVKPFECSVCLKTFTTKQWRDNHLKTHRE